MVGHDVGGHAGRAKVGAVAPWLVLGSPFVGRYLSTGRGP